MAAYGRALPCPLMGPSRRRDTVVECLPPLTLASDGHGTTAHHTLDFSGAFGGAAAAAAGRGDGGVCLFMVYFLTSGSYETFYTETSTRFPRDTRRQQLPKGRPLVNG